MAKDISYKQKRDILHALGLTDGLHVYRNYFTCGDSNSWNDLCAKGYAVKRPSMVCSGYMYHVTRSGYEAVKTDKHRSPDNMFPHKSLSAA
ncbi:MAG: hypothetical protein JKX72_03850 [Robiginitomaculum sp.]|nr:hypothetical protein [Robiginitomaculum sp.]